MTQKLDNIPKFAGVGVGSLTTKSVIMSNGTILGYGLEEVLNYSGKV